MLDGYVGKVQGHVTGSVRGSQEAGGNVVRRLPRERSVLKPYFYGRCLCLGRTIQAAAAGSQGQGDGTKTRPQHLPHGSATIQGAGQARTGSLMSLFDRFLSVSEHCAMQ